VAVGLGRAGRRAAVPVDVVAIVAVLTWIEEAVAARRSDADAVLGAGADDGAHGGAEGEVDVREAAREQVAVAHDRAAARWQRRRTAVAARLLVVALVDRRIVAMRVRRPEVVAELVRHHL